MVTSVSCLSLFTTPCPALTAERLLDFLNYGDEQRKLRPGLQVSPAGMAVMLVRSK